MEFSSINEMFRWRVEKSSNQTALLHKNGDRWTEISWIRYYESVRHIAQGLRGLGLEKGDRVLLFSDTRVEWVFCDLAILGCCGVVVPAYHSSPTREIEYIINHSQSKFVIVENSLLLDRVLEVRERLQSVEKIILIEGPAPDDDSDLLSLSDVVEIGRKQKPGLYEEMAKEASIEDDATIVYTSTQGGHLGVIHRHRQLLSEQYALQPIIQVREDEITLLFLPLSHVFGRTLEYLNLYTGLKIAFAENYERLFRNLEEVRPHMVAAVPRVFQKIYSNLMKEIELQGRSQKLKLHWCLDIGKQVTLLQQNRQPIPLVLNAKYQAARKLFFDRFRAQFGSRLKFMVSSGAPLPREIAEFFLATGLVILEAYGMTETAGAVTMNALNDYRTGSVGKPLPGIDIQLDSDGEIMIKGAVVTEGYLGNQEATERALQSGWLRSGDIGEVDSDGFLKITDRKKDLIITSGGKNISPQALENHLKADPFIDMIYVHGDNRNFLSALITLNRQNVEQWAKEKGVVSKNFEDLCAKQEIIRLIEERIQIKNRDLSSPETIKKFAILPHSFSVETGELTSSQKLRRKHIDSKYQEILEQFYT